MRTLKNRFAVLLSLLALVGAAQAQVGSGEIPTAEAPAVLRNQAVLVTVVADDQNVGDLFQVGALGALSTLKNVDPVLPITEFGVGASQTLLEYLEQGRFSAPIPKRSEDDPKLALAIRLSLKTEQDALAGALNRLSGGQVELTETRERWVGRGILIDLSSGRVLRQIKLDAAAKTQVSNRFVVSLADRGWTGLLGLATTLLGDREYSQEGVDQRTLAKLIQQTLDQMR